MNSSTVNTVNSHIALIGDSSTSGAGPQILFSESDNGQAFAGATIGFERTGDNSMGDLIFSTRRVAGSKQTVTTESMRITSEGFINIDQTFKMSNNTSVLGGIQFGVQTFGDGSGSTNNMLSVNGNDVSYGFYRYQVEYTSTITHFDASSVRQSARIIVHIEGTAGKILTIRGSGGGGLLDVGPIVPEVNFTDDIVIDDNEDCLLTLFVSNNKLFIRGEKYIKAD